MTLLIGGSCYLDFAIIYIFAESVDIDISRDTIMSTIVMLCHLWYNWSLIMLKACVDLLRLECSLLRFQFVLVSSSISKFIYMKISDQFALETEARISPLINEKRRLFNDLLTAKCTNLLQLSSGTLCLMHMVFCLFLFGPPSCFYYNRAK